MAPPRPQALSTFCLSRTSFRHVCSSFIHVPPSPGHPQPAAPISTESYDQSSILSAASAPLVASMLMFDELLRHCHIVKLDFLSWPAAAFATRLCFEVHIFFFLFLKAIFINLLAVLGLHAKWVFCSFRERRLLSASGTWASCCRGFSGCGVWALGHRLKICGKRGFSCSTAYGNLPGPGIEPVSPALAGRF